MFSGSSDGLVFGLIVSTVCGVILAYMACKQSQINKMNKSKDIEIIDYRNGYITLNNRTNNNGNVLEVVADREYNIKEHPAELVYTSATVGGITTGGFHVNEAYRTESIGGKTGTSEKIDVFDANGQRVLDKIVSFVGVAPMDDPRYIVLVALDTPSRETGIYISGGVMAAPTVGAVMADILPYLGVAQTGEDAPSWVTLENVTGLSAGEAEKRLKAQGLSAVTEGFGTQVVSQIPVSGQSVPVGSQVLLYLGEPPRDDE
jgi:hypothetical protein